MKRFVKIKAPPNNPDVGKLPDGTIDPYNPRVAHPERIFFVDYDPDAHWEYGELRPDYEKRGHVPNPYLSHREVGESSGKDYDPTCQLAIDCAELLENDSGQVPRYRPGDMYRVATWATRLRALHIKS